MWIKHSNNGVINDTEDFCNVINIVANNGLPPHLHLTKYKILVKRVHICYVQQITLQTCNPNAIIPLGL